MSPVSLLSPWAVRAAILAARSGVSAVDRADVIPRPSGHAPGAWTAQGWRDAQGSDAAQLAARTGAGPRRQDPAGAGQGGAA